MLRSWRQKPRQNESRWRTPRIEPLDPLCRVVFYNSTPIGRANSGTANSCGDCWAMEQIDILRHAVEALERMNVPYLVVGSFASIAYGESRFTQDIDITAAFQLRHVSELLAAFPPDEFYLSESAVRDAIR